MNDFFSERKKRLHDFKVKFLKKTAVKKQTDIPDGLFLKCEECQKPIYEKELEAQLHVCPNCGFHFRINAKKRIAMLADDDTFVEVNEHLESTNPLGMPFYEEKLNSAKKFTNQNDAFISGSCTIGDYPCFLGVLDSFFMMGSMGSVVGEKVTRLIELAIKEHKPLVIVSASGGARMQEGILSLMQMAKTAGALKKLEQEKLLYISVMTYPTTGGVAASFATLGDINIAEKSALIGFAGSRVIKQTIKEELPAHFQSAEFQKEHGLIDLVVERKQLKSQISALLKLHQGGHKA
ncbi:Acetyl-coenzyme A carboxylase carboxyl transferase, subunit beta [Paracholeplasma brassicae]|uniref:Acetyl-coenzyme A carboxylase carboxyl transferase subunit beta n=1 Tax=Acholeplasma brassicae TaxID=61635 RepID=U4KMJ3_9MOLU|nr:acetyl-CoA carboxylase, carboxyltransferase subunit beta [Paracholeplasma brassicae]CCV65382.1 Acetyl-coenzyme A carboxylase carboxyl transferase, subunit beta [Paracholeplasma brassicae]